MITKRELLMGRVSEDKLPKELLDNLNSLHKKINVIREAYKRPMTVSSGYRSPEINKKVGGAKNSWHLKCAAVDIFDNDGALQKWISKNEALLISTGLWVEDFKYTKGWVHFQIYPPKSGELFFKP